MQRLADPALGGKEVRESSFEFLRIDDLFHGLKVTSQRRIEGEDDSLGRSSRRSQLLAEMTLPPFSELKLALEQRGLSYPSPARSPHLQVFPSEDPEAWHEVWLASHQLP